jgi:hypothetical protein
MLQWESQPKSPGWYFVRDPKHPELDFSIKLVFQLSESSPLVCINRAFDGHREPAIAGTLGWEWEGPITPEMLNG